MSIKPAYHISLSSRQKSLIGELAALQSQCEWLMQLAVRRVLDVSMDTVRVLMGSTNIGANSEIFITVLREKCEPGDALLWAEYAYAQVADLSRSRNDFLHTLYGMRVTDEDGVANSDGGILFAYGHRADTFAKSPKHRVAIRVRSHALVPLSRLEEIRDRAAYLTMVFAHIDWLVSPHHTQPSPWPRRLKRRLPPVPAKAAPRKAKAPPPLPAPSQE